MLNPKPTIPKPTMFSTPSLPLSNKKKAKTKTNYLRGVREAPPISAAHAFGLYKCGLPLSFFALRHTRILCKE